MDVQKVMHPGFFFITMSFKGLQIVNVKGTQIVQESICISIS